VRPALHYVALRAVTTDLAGSGRGMPRQQQSSRCTAMAPLGSTCKRLLRGVSMQGHAAVDQMAVADLPGPNPSSCAFASPSMFNHCREYGASPLYVIPCIYPAMPSQPGRWHGQESWAPSLYKPLCNGSSSSTKSLLSWGNGGLYVHPVRYFASGSLAVPSATIAIACTTLCQTP